MGTRLLAQKLVVEHVVLDPNRGVQMLGVPRKPVDAVDAVKLDAAGFNQGARRFDEVKVAGFVDAPAGSRKDDDRVAPLAEYQHVNILAEVMRVKAAVLFLHKKGR
ncbi:hypothetical protein ACFQT0_18390 [Hymenobacter humi]|uniref:Uncharacterized protein n=1 Tax=Hymenobacter humi TaxID=1411620 RepID=A0ABW2UA58_9BACT